MEYLTEYHVQLVISYLCLFLFHGAHVLSTKT